MSTTTVNFIHTTFTHGAEYVEDVDLTGLYPRVSHDKEYGKYEYQEPQVIRRIYDVRDTSITNLRVPDKYTDKIYQYTEQEVDVNAKGALPFRTLEGPFRSLMVLPEPELYPAFRFWVPQDSEGADEGRTVDDLTANGCNWRTRIREKLQLPNLDDFVAMVMRVSVLFPESIWGTQEFFKQDMRKAFRQVPGNAASRKWGAFTVRNPQTSLLEVFQHLSLPFGARAAPLIFCSVAEILCE